jgi:colanic acid/amylovoran biosynthesis glycosyltransferase
MRLAYLISRYPLVSHAFILREVEALRALGVEIEPFTVVRADRDEVIEETTRREDARTTALRPVALPRLAATHLAALARRPGGYVRALRRALALRRGGLRDLVWQLAYFAQGILLARGLRSRGLRHVHVHHANVAADVALYACAYDSGLTWSLTLHGPTELADVEGHRLAAKLGDARFVACISDYARSQAMALTADWDKLHTVRLGVDLTAFTPARRDGRAGALRVLSVGRLAQQKGQAVLLRAIARAGDGVELTLAGDGPLRGELERVAAELGIAVEFAGAVGHDRIAELYARADVFCLTSFAEGIPVVLMEAMACELPVVAPAIMGIPELVEDVLVPPGRPDLVADALRALAADPERRAALGRAGREIVAARYDQAASARALRELLREHCAP